MWKFRCMRDIAPITYVFRSKSGHRWNGVGRAQRATTWNKIDFGRLDSELTTPDSAPIDAAQRHSRQLHPEARQGKIFY